MSEAMDLNKEKNFFETRVILERWRASRGLRRPGEHDAIQDGDLALLRAPGLRADVDLDRAGSLNVDQILEQEGKSIE
jgi:hypothetical protein